MITHYNNTMRSTPGQLLFNIIYGALLTSPILGGEYTAALAAIGYLLFLPHISRRKFDAITRICIIGLVLSLTAMFVLLIVHWKTITTGDGRADLTLIEIAWFGAFFMLVDAVRYQIVHFKINLQNFARFTLFLLLSIILIKIAWVVTTGNEVGPGQLFQIASRRIALINLTPNHADNVVVFQIVLVSWITLIMMKRFPEKPALVIGLGICLYMVFLILVINSRSAYLGIIFASILAAVLFSRNITRRQLMFTLISLAVIAMILPDTVKYRIQTGTEQIRILFNHTPEDTLDKTAGDQQEKVQLRAEIIAVLNGDMPKQESEKPRSQRIWELCYTHDSVGTLADHYKIDVSVYFRTLLLLDGFQLWKEHPLLGHGNYDKKTIIEKYPQIDACRIGYFSHIHNHYLSLAIRGGLFSLVVFALLSVTLFTLLLYQRSTLTRQHFYVGIPPLMYFFYLYLENLFDLSFNKDAPLTAVLFSLSVIVGANMSYSDSEQQIGHNIVDKP